jgi:hypothetical protein
MDMHVVAETLMMLYVVEREHAQLQSPFQAKCCQMSRRKHVLQSSLMQDVEPPEDGQQIVRAVGSRGGNIIEASVMAQPHLRTGCIRC